MKVTASSVNLWSYQPLYPTWFRWKIDYWVIGYWVIGLYIPHGSDERWLPQQRPEVPNQLYIPHGSDESNEMSITPWYDITLYPTWFRWKMSFSHAKLCEMYSFISHMVQMKAQKSNNARKIVITLYPTWFRWKGIRLVFFHLYLQLYIPHGSDESYSCSHNIHIPNPSLYPTWFRWKQ